MPLVYEQECKVFQFECDPWNRMTPGAVLRRVQEIGTEQCEELGLNEEMYRQTHTVFMLSRVSLEVSEMPVMGQKILLRTRAYGMKRAVYHRVTSLHNEAGDKLCEADSRWVLVDTQTRRILRKEPDTFINPFVELPEEEHSMVIPKAEELELVATYNATYTLCDSNKHINNARYADMMCDCLPLAKLEQGPVKKMLLFFRSEIPLEASFELLRAKAGGNGFYCVAQQQGKKNFEGYVGF